MSHARPDLYDLIERISRLGALPSAEAELSAREAALLRYLGQANPFSRSPATIATYLGISPAAARTAIRALEAAGLVSIQRPGTAREPGRCDLTEKGQKIALESPLIPVAVETLSPTEIAILSEGLSKTLRALLMRRGQRSFGICNTCRFHETRPTGAFCGLVKVDLDPGEIEKMCVECEPA